MLLVPKQLQRVGMTGMMPDYGGRLSPARLTGHPIQPPHRLTLRSLLPQAGPSHGHPYRRPGSLCPAVRHRGPSPHQLALQHLLDTGVITQVEFQQLQARVIRSSGRCKYWSSASISRRSPVKC